jgi:hypothetical protein
VLPWGLALGLAWAGSAWAAERVTVGQLHKYPQSYHLKSVKVVGKVEQMRAFPPRPVVIGRCRFLYGIAEFVLIDETGSLPVETQGNCFEATHNLPHDGDQIEVTVQIHLSTPRGGTKHVMKAIVQEIVAVK